MPVNRLNGGLLERRLFLPKMKTTTEMKSTSKMKMTSKRRLYYFCMYSIILGDALTTVAMRPFSPFLGDFFLWFTPLTRISGCNTFSIPVYCPTCIFWSIKEYLWIYLPCLFPVLFLTIIFLFLCVICINHILFVYVNLINHISVSVCNSYQP